MAPNSVARLRNFDWFRKELRAFMTTVTRTEVLIDRSDTLRINFNFTFPHLACQYASVDVSDVLGMSRYNLTKTVRKRSVTSEGTVVGDLYSERSAELQHEPEDSPLLAQAALTPEEEAEGVAAAGGAVELSEAALTAAQKRHPLVLVNFYAPWCPWSQRLAPVWDATAKTLHAKYPPSTDGRVLLGRVDCTAEADACRTAQVQGFPSVRVYRGGTDLVANPAALGRAGSSQEHAQYVGDRTVEALLDFAESLVPPDGVAFSPRAAGHLGAGFAAAAARGVLERGAHPGCAVDGFVTVKKVPGALFVSAQSEAHSFVAGAMNASHTVHSLTVGPAPSARRLAELARLMPGGLPPNWADKLAGQSFASPEENTTHEHYLQIVRTVVTPLGGGGRVWGVAASAPGYQPGPAGIDCYEYTAHSHAFEAEGGALPHAKFSYSPSPMLVHISESSRYGAYHFLTTVSALIGGVFTVASIADSGAHAVQRLVKKQGLGKFQ